jgi:hypothetical protein
MRRHMVRVLLAAVAAGGALLTAGLAAAPVAGAATSGTHTGGFPVLSASNFYTSSQGGYTATGRWFRFVATTVKMPPKSPLYPIAVVVLGGSSAGPLYVGVRPGGGPTSVGWSAGVPPFGMGGFAFTKVDPKVGDTVLIDLYYSRSNGKVTAAATDLTTGATQSAVIGGTKNAVFTAAEVAGWLEPPAPSPPATNLRLWQFNKTAVTTYTGVHGTMTGPWTTNKVTDTTNGTSSGRVVMSPSFLFNNGASFGVWLRAK